MNIERTYGDAATGLRDSSGRRRTQCVWLLGCVICLLATAACSLPMPQATADPTKFYVLSVPANAGAATAPATAPAVRLRPIDLANYLQGRAMVVRHGENQVDFREFARWGEPLEQGIARVLREELLTHGGVSFVQPGNTRSSEIDVRYDVSVRVLACEGDTDGSVDFEAMWQIISTGDNPAVVAHGNFRPTDLHWTPRSEATLALALSHAVAGLGAQIAAAIPKG